MNTFKIRNETRKLRLEINNQKMYKYCLRISVCSAGNRFEPKILHLSLTVLAIKTTQHTSIK